MIAALKVRLILLKKPDIIIGLYELPNYEKNTHMKRTISLWSKYPATCKTEEYDYSKLINYRRSAVNLYQSLSKLYY